MKSSDEILCMLGFHRWTKWKETDRGDLTERIYGTLHKRVIGRYVKQERVCNVCGKISFRIEQQTT